MLDADRDHAPTPRPPAGGARHEQRSDTRDLNSAGEHHHVAGERGDGRAGDAYQQRAHLAGAPITVQQQEQRGAGRSQPHGGARQVEPEQIGDAGDRRPQRCLDAAGAVEKRRFHGHQGDRRCDPDPRDDAGGNRLARREAEDDDRRGNERGGYQRQLEPTAQHRDATSRCGPAPALRPLWRSTGRPPNRDGGSDRSPCSAVRTGSGSTGRG